MRQIKFRSLLIRIKIHVIIESIRKEKSLHAEIEVSSKRFKLLNKINENSTTTTKTKQNNFERAMIKD